MPLKPCLDCGKLSPSSRCPTHTRTAETLRTARKRIVRPYTWTEQRRRAEAVQAWTLVYGYWCPGWRREPHPSTDLTADHIHAVAAGGREDGPLAVLCRSCNSAKRDHQ